MLEEPAKPFVRNINGTLYSQQLLPIMVTCHHKTYWNVSHLNTNGEKLIRKRFAGACRDSSKRQWLCLKVEPQGIVFVSVSSAGAKS